MPMMLLKSVAFGALVALGGGVAWVMATVLMGLQGIAVTGAGGLGAVSGPIPGWSGLLASLAGFALGSTWMYRRLNRRGAR